MWSEIIKTPERFEYMLLPKLFGVAERAWAKNPEWATETDTVKSASIYNQNWSEFVNIIGKREMPRLNHYAGGYNYRIPTPGVVVANGKVMANLQLPGFIIRYTTDGTEPTVNSAAYLVPLSTKGDIILKVFNNNGRSGRSVKIHNN
ncbi:chitobiase/beta-hexosaminidase C-terminal domain-containing protein [Pedobacter steynii]